MILPLFSLGVGEGAVGGRLPGVGRGGPSQGGWA